MRMSYLTLLLLSLSPLCAQEMVRTYEFTTKGNTRVTTTVFIKDAHDHDFAYIPLQGSKPALLSAHNLNDGAELAVSRRGTQVSIALPANRKNRSEVRLSIAESLPGDDRTFSTTLKKGRYVFILPSGFGIESCSLPAQVQFRDGRLVVGIVQASPTPSTVTLEMIRTSKFSDRPASVTLRALDDRLITYDLGDPSAHKIRLWLEMYVANPGQSHFYSQLRLQDATSDPVTLDVDHGDEIPTRIVSGQQANSIGDAPSAFPQDSRVLVADLGYRIPENGSARLRSFQTATDSNGYRLTGPNEFRLDRFLARTLNRYILPAGWNLAYTDQPAEISRDEHNRVVLDFVLSGKDALPLTIVGERASTNE